MDRLSTVPWTGHRDRQSRITPRVVAQISAGFVRRQLVGLGRFELPTSRLSGVRSNQLSYRPGGRLNRRTNRPTHQDPAAGLLLAGPDEGFALLLSKEPCRLEARRQPCSLKTEWCVILSGLTYELAPSTPDLPCGPTSVVSSFVP